MTMQRELAALGRLSTKDLKQRFAEVFGEATSTSNRPWLLKRIAWRMQAEAEGGLSERARRRAEELARDADVRMTPPRHVDATIPEVVASARDPRLPAPGAVIVRTYKGARLEVTVLRDSFVFAGETFKTLTAVAKHITGSHCNGFAFFGLGGGAR